MHISPVFTYSKQKIEWQVFWEAWSNNIEICKGHLKHTQLLVMYYSRDNWVLKELWRRPDNLILD